MLNQILSLFFLNSAKRRSLYSIAEASLANTGEALDERWAHGRAVSPVSDVLAETKQGGTKKNPPKRVKREGAAACTAAWLL